MKTVKFEHAVDAIRDGKRVYRTSWPRNTFIFQQVPAIVDKSIVPNMQSLPQSVKEHFERLFNHNPNVKGILYINQIAQVEYNKIRGYAFLPEDVLATDWIVLD